MNWALLLGMVLVAGHGWCGETTVTVDGRENCLEVDYREVARRVHLLPGEYTFYLEDSPGIAFGSTSAYRNARAHSVLLDFDPACVSLRDGSPIAAYALYYPEGHYLSRRVRVSANRATSACVYVIDRNAADNSGSMVVGVYRGEHLYGDTEKPLATLTVDGKRNCVEADLRKVGKAITLAPGKYHAEFSGPGIIYGWGSRYRNRPAMNVLLDMDPSKVSVRDVGCGDPPDGKLPRAPVAAMGGVWGGNFEVHRRTTIYAYVIDYHATGNSGEMAVTVRTGSSGI